MTDTKKTYMGIKRLAKEYKITIPAARTALIAGKVMTLFGDPVKPEYAKTSQMEDGNIWHQWDTVVAGKAFKKRGYKEGGDIEILGHPKSRYQAQTQIEKCLYAIGSIAGFVEHELTDNIEVNEAIKIWFSAGIGDCHAIGGPGAVVMIYSPENCNNFLERLHSVTMAYIATCKRLAPDDKAREEIDRYHDALKRLSKWVESQYFKL